MVFDATVLIKYCVLFLIILHVLYSYGCCNPSLGNAYWGPFFLTLCLFNEFTAFDAAVLIDGRSSSCFTFS